MVHGLLAVGHALGVDKMIRVFGNVRQSHELRVALQVLPGRRRSREETEMLDFGVREIGTS